MLTLRVSRGCGRAEFDADEQQIRFFDSAGLPEIVQLSFSESRTLQLLSERAGEVVGRDDIMKFAWSSRVVASGSINQCIFSLRNILGDDKDHQIIQTVTRKGYKLNLDALIVTGNDSEELPTRRYGVASSSVSGNQSLDEAQEVDAESYNDASVRPPGRLGFLRRKRFFFRSKQLAWSSLLLVALAVMFVTTIDLKATRFFSHLVAIDPPVLTEYEMKGYQFFLFDMEQDHPVVTELVSKLGAPKERPVQLVLHRWGDAVSVSCVNARRYAINARIDSRADAAIALASLIATCEAK